MYPLVRSFMLVGSGAGVGKTLVACAIVQGLRQRGVHATAMKPLARLDVQRDGRWSSSELERLAASSSFGLPPHALCPAVLPAGSAAARPGELLEAAVDTFQVLSTWSDAVVVEGADDLLGDGVGCDSAQLARELALPVVLVAGSSATDGPAMQARMAQLARRGIECLGWVANRHAAGGPDAPEPAALRSLPRLGSIPWLERCTPGLAAPHIDLERACAVLAE